MTDDRAVEEQSQADGEGTATVAELQRQLAQWKRADHLLRALTESTAATLGGDFFPQLVRHLATALGVRDAFVAECLPNQRARSLGFWTGGHPADNFEYDLEGTPCLRVLEGTTRFYPSNLPELFPKVKLAGDRAPQSYFGAPMFDGARRVIGHLVVSLDRPWVDEPLLLSGVETFAARAGAELERARAAHRERAILDVNNAIISNLTEDALLRSISEALGRVVPFDRAALTLHDPATDTLRILALSGRLPPRSYPVGVALDRKDSHVGWVFEHHRTLLRRDLEKERQFGPEHRLYEEGVRSLCTAPMLLAGRCIGTLTLGSTTPNQFTEVEELFLRDVSSQLALAISNMRAFEEIATLKARLEAENLYLQEEIRGEYNFSEIVGQSAALREVLRQVDQVAPIDSTVLITGETGSGKELVARAIDGRSARRERSLVKVHCGAIRAGLFYRLIVVPIQVPPLRVRTRDVELLVQFFLQRFAKKFDRPIRRIAPETMARLVAYAWPGNIRELQNVVERAVVLSRGDTLTIAPDIAPAVTAAAPAAGGDTLNDVERRHIEAVLRQKNWTIEGERGAARVLNMHPNTLRSRIKKLGLRRPGDTA